MSDEVLLSARSEEGQGNRNTPHALVFPLYTRKDLRMVLCVSREDEPYSDNETLVATLFAEGVEHIIERVYFLRALWRQNTLLQKEKAEQQK